jgi:hypothetical protein
VERPDPHPVGQPGAERLQRREDTLTELLGRAPVERDGTDRLRRHALIDQPRDPGNEGRRLAGSRRRDAQHRAGLGGCSLSLIGLKPLEARGDGGMTGHRRSLATAAHRSLTRAFVDGAHRMRCVGAPFVERQRVPGCRGWLEALS